MISDLSSNWFCEGTIDFELKQYALLAYLQYVSDNFQKKKLYRTLSDLISHRYKLLSFKHHSEHLEDEFPKELMGLGINQQRALEYRNTEKKNSEIEEIKSIVEYALVEIEEKITEGTKIYDSVGKEIYFDEIGIIPILKDSGYLIVFCFDQYKVYQYKKTLIISNNERYGGLNLKWWAQYDKNISTTFDSIKGDILKIPDIGIPAVYAISFKPKEFPYEETILPVIKREFITYLTKNSMKDTL